MCGDMKRITSDEDIAIGLDGLVSLDGRLIAVRERAGPLPLRLVEPGFRSLAAIITGQQVSRASADAIFGRFVKLVDPLTPEALLAAGESVFREAGQSRAKTRTLLALAEACRAGHVDLHHVLEMQAEAAIAHLTAVKGIGPWTAELYLLFCAGHPDVFPAHDVALQTAVGDALGLEMRPPAPALRQIAESWSPWRGVAARLFWAYYARIRSRDAIPVVPKPA